MYLYFFFQIARKFNGIFYTWKIVTVSNPEKSITSLAIDASQTCS